MHLFGGKQNHHLIPFKGKGSLFFIVDFKKNMEYHQLYPLNAEQS